MKTMATWLLITLGAFAALAGGYHVALEQSPRKLLVVVDSSFPMSPRWSRVAGLLDRLDDQPYTRFGLITEKSRMRGGRRHFFRRDGTPEQGKNAGNTNLHDARWDQAFHPQGRNKRTVWSIPLSKFREAHFAVFPERLVETCVLAGCPLDGVVLDPFLGSGTTALVARRLGRRYLGIDCVQAYCEMATRRLAKEEQ